MPSYQIRRSVNDILLQAFKELQMIGQGESFSGDLFDRGLRSLNRYIQVVQAFSLNLWTETEGTLFLTKDQFKYPLESSVLANDYVKTTLSVAAVATDTTITLVAPSTIAITDVIRVILDDGSALDTTVAGVAGDVISLDDPLPSDAAIGNFIYSHVADSFKPISNIKDLSFRRVENRSGEDSEINVQSWNRKEYFALPDKENPGTPTIAYYQRQDSVTRTGIIYTWDSPLNSDIRFNFSYYRKMCVFGTEDGEMVLDAPDYFQDAIILNLAYRLGTKMGCERALFQSIKKRSIKSMAMVMNYNVHVSGRAINIMGEPKP